MLSLLLCLGLVAAIFSVLASFNGQRATKTVECDQLVPDMKASIPVAHYVPGSSGFFRISPGRYEVYNDMKGALIAGLSNPATINSTIAATTLLSGSCAYDGSALPSQAPFACASSFWLDAFFANWTASASSDIAAVVENLAVAATNKMRVTGKTAAVDNGAAVGIGRGEVGDRSQGAV
ncbi:hypothetical protein C8A00DRAFT_37325 [Chaetomidium leptoderma]|uniref:Uncharacterized protein n=1 Tax=Chaetomidium leptoderma TaxID=669021 RepID=A0AAN6VEQ6_9PEZI|nr:hypothetical protein C8A00DRAFT_37325 [Chaetomidium leptoderma]